MPTLTPCRKGTRKLSASPFLLLSVFMALPGTHRHVIHVIHGWALQRRGQRCDCLPHFLILQFQRALTGFFVFHQNWDIFWFIGNSSKSSKSGKGRLQFFTILIGRNTCNYVVTSQRVSLVLIRFLDH